MNNRHLIIIPAYNEEPTIGKVIKRTKELFSDIDILVINDSSTDRTFQIAKNEGVRVISHPFNLGYGGALQTGYKYALAENYNYVVQMDADGQHTPEFIINLLEEIQKGKDDLIIGSRFFDNNGYQISLPRKIGIWIFSKIILLITGKKITDPTSGFQAMNSKVLKLYISEHFPTDYPDADIIIFILRMGLGVKEIPVSMYTSHGKSMHDGLKGIYYVIKMLLVIFVNQLRYKKGLKNGF